MANPWETSAFKVNGKEYKCPYGSKGDRLWGQEGFQLVEPASAVKAKVIGGEYLEVDGKLPKEKPDFLGSSYHLVYQADNPDQCAWWRHSVQMPRWASRITLEITGVRVERLQNISDADILNSGLGHPTRQPDENKGSFIDYWIWNLPGKKGFSWHDNPYVWVMTFKVAPQPPNESRINTNNTNS